MPPLAPVLVARTRTGFNGFSAKLPNRLTWRRSTGPEATWRSGDAADCKSAYPGSIPGVASSKINKLAAIASLGKSFLTHI